jgi:hypothetical protein
MAVLTVCSLPRLARKPACKLRSYMFARSGGRRIFSDLCHVKAGTDASVHAAREWMIKNAGNTGVGAPKVSEGPLLIQVK